MKRSILMFVFILSGAVLYAAPPVAEAPIDLQSTAGCLSISTSVWTAVPTSPYTSRLGLYVTEVATNTANMAGHIGTTTTPTLGLRVHPIVFKPGITQYHGLSAVSILYLLSLHSSAESACYQEVKQ